MKKKQGGFTLLELMVTVVVVAILASIAYPTYTRNVTRSRRAAAEACLASLSSYMERFNATNLRYDRDTAATAVTLPTSIDCQSTANAGGYYTFSLQAVAVSSYTLQAVPGTIQASADAECGTLTLNNRGVRGSASTDQTACWSH